MPRIKVPSPFFTRLSSSSLVYAPQARGPGGGDLARDGVVLQTAGTRDLGRHCTRSFHSGMRRRLGGLSQHGAKRSQLRSHPVLHDLASDPPSRSTLPSHCHTRGTTQDPGISFDPKMLGWECNSGLAGLRAGRAELGKGSRRTWKDRGPYPFALIRGGPAWGVQPHDRS